MLATSDSLLLENMYVFESMYVHHRQSKTGVNVTLVPQQTNLLLTATNYTAWGVSSNDTSFIL